MRCTGTDRSRSSPHDHTSTHDYRPSSCAAYYDYSRCASSRHHYSAYPSPGHHQDYEQTGGAYYHEQAAYDSGKS